MAEKEFKKKKKTSLEGEMSPLMIVLCVILSCYVISLVVPFFWGILTSLKGKYELRSNVFGLPQDWLFSNYVTAFNAYTMKITYGATFTWVYLEEMLLNSFLHSIGCSVIKTFCVCIVAYVTAKFSHFIFSKFLNTLVLILMMIPIVGSLPSELALARALGLYDHIWGLWLMAFNFLGMHYFVFSAMFSNIPKDYADAAYIDGASEWQVLGKIMLPMARNTFFVIVLLNFIGYWNDYSTALLYLPSHPTLALGLHSFSTSTDNELASVPMKLTGCMILLLPILTLFLIFHDKMIGKISIGGLKE